jgi:hypothetical protein
MDAGIAMSWLTAAGPQSRVHSTILRDDAGNLRRLMCITDQLQPVVDEAAEAAAGFTRAYHGTSLSTAFIILQSSFRAGEATDNGRTGLFCIANTTVGKAFGLARDRAKTERCTEWVAWGVPSAWSLPVVLSFSVRTEELVHCGNVGSGQKMVIPCTPSTQLTRGFVELWYDVNELQAFKALHQSFDDQSHKLQLHGIAGRYADVDNIDVMCGGKLHDALFWSRPDNNMPASCGRVVNFKKLCSEGWRFAKNRSIIDRIYRCPRCAASFSN